MFLHRRHTNGQKTHVKMPSISSYSRNANENHDEMPLYTNYDRVGRSWDFRLLPVGMAHGHFGTQSQRITVRRRNPTPGFPETWRQVFKQKPPRECSRQRFLWQQVGIGPCPRGVDERSGVRPHGGMLLGNEQLSAGTHHNMNLENSKRSERPVTGAHTLWFCLWRMKCPE